MSFKNLILSAICFTALTALAFAQSNFATCKQDTGAGPTKQVSIMDKSLGIPALTGQIPQSWKVINSDFVMEGTNTAIRFFATSPDKISKFVYLQKPVIQADLSGENVVNALLIPQTRQIADGGKVQLVNKQFSPPQQTPMGEAKQFAVVLRYSMKGQPVQEAHTGTIASMGGQYGIMLTTYAQRVTNDQDFMQNMQRIYSSFQPNPQWMQAMQQKLQQMQQQGAGQYQQQMPQQQYPQQQYPQQQYPQQQYPQFQQQYPQYQQQMPQQGGW